jgi:glycosyltransferase involved in cell wall biosynthesis
MKEYNINSNNNNVAQLSLVSICSITYNHEPYIRQCLDGFLMQKTNFKYEIIIHDDASTDGTAEIIKEYAERYPDLITPVFQTENQYSKGLRGFYAKFVFPRAKGKYIALCEGDDYWTDPLKLQKQVDFLEANPDFVMCSHCFDVLLQEAGTFENKVEDTNLKYSLIDITNGTWPAQTLTVLFRANSLLDKCYGVVTGDVALFYFLLKQGNGMRLKDNMATYRIHKSGLWGGVSGVNRIKSSFDVRLSIYQLDKSKDAANYLLSVFKTPIPQEWYHEEWSQLIEVLRIMIRHINPIKVIKYLIINYISACCR